MRADDPALEELFRIVFGVDRGALHHQWKYRDNPDGPAIIAVAEDQGRLVGQYALWPTRLRLGDAVVKGAQSLDTMTHPDYRGQGMFTRLAEAAMGYAAGQGVEVLYGFPNANSQPGFVNRLDWDLTGTVPAWIRPLRPSRHRRVPPWAGGGLDLAARLLPSGRTGSFEMRSGAPDAASLEGLLQHWRSSFRGCRVERDAQRYAWRFAAASGFEYRWLTAYRDATAEAAAIWGVSPRGGGAVLAEVLSTGADRAREAVVSAAVHAAREAGCPFMAAVSSGGAGLLARCGFLPRPALPLIVRKLTTRTLGANVHAHANWDLFGADVDTF